MNCAIEKPKFNFSRKKNHIGNDAENYYVRNQFKFCKSAIFERNTLTLLSISILCLEHKITDRYDKTIFDKIFHKIFIINNDIIVNLN